MDDTDLNRLMAGISMVLVNQSTIMGALVTIVPLRYTDIIKALTEQTKLTIKITRDIRDELEANLKETDSAVR